MDTSDHLGRDQSDGVGEPISFFPDSALALDIAINETSRLRQIAARIRADDPHIWGTFGSRTRSGILPTRCVFIGDTREIALARPNAETTFEYRLSLLARAGDLVVFSGAPNSAFEAYRSDYLSRGPICPVTPRLDESNPLKPLADRCRLDPDVISYLSDVARQDGGLTIVPHISLGAVWRLAAELSERASVDVCVAGPPPVLTERVNDKLWFSRFAVTILGRDSIAPTYSAHSFASLVGRVRKLTHEAGRLVVKIPDSAGGLGIVCFAPHEFERTSLLAVKDQIKTVLHTLGWRGTFPLLIGLWEAPAVCSPSAQLWIPLPPCGSPILEGIFEQRLEGRQGIFVGCMPTKLPDRWQMQMAQEAIALATVLQGLGYYGRCSLDAIIIGPDLDHGRLHWIECNGRWGGVSIPLSLVRQLAYPRKPKFVVIQRTEGVQTPRPFARVVAALDPLLYRRGTRDQGIVLLSPCEAEAGLGIQMLAMGATLDVAERISTQSLATLFGNNAYS